jgi:3-methylcrotonyl-CoA carboxylase alpha subunit
MSWITIDHDGLTHRLAVARTVNGVWVGWPGRTRFFERESRDAAAGMTHDAIRAPMTGRVVQLRAKPGDQVAAKAILVVMEAMKMEYRLTAPHDGTVAAVHCSEGDLVDLGKTLVTLDK